jgi:cytochrome oxidase Cu insertion factor (SCO1/SenC/PrrC family)
VGAGLPAHGHEAPGAGRDRETADAAAPAFGTVIDFELTDAGGNRVRAVDLRGHWLLIFFGYTYCPDLCPTTLSEIAGALAQLGPLATQLQPVFISIDPQRDTPEALREYVQSFDARVLPLTGMLSSWGGLQIPLASSSTRCPARHRTNTPSPTTRS